MYEDSTFLPVRTMHQNLAKGRAMRYRFGRRGSLAFLLMLILGCSAGDRTRSPNAVENGQDESHTSIGWILLDSNREHVSRVLTLAQDFGVDHVQLSHDLIMDIDDINEDEQRAAFLQDIAREAHDHKLKVWVWSHEFTNESYFICLDPDDPLWERRKNAYRQALERVPEIEGVILMFGSSDVEPWYAPCFCDWCTEQPPTGNPLLDLIHSRPVDRLQQIYAAVSEVVTGEFGKELRIRTFMHMPWELRWLGDSLRTLPDANLKVMSKDVPQDWQPYYPHNPLIGDVGQRHQIVEMDLGNEYWGRSRILNCQVDYLYDRIGYDRQKGANGAAARIERGSDHAFGNPNEINIHAFTRYLQDAWTTPGQVYHDWFELRYGLSPASEASFTLKGIFRSSHLAVRKMYYTLGMWTLEKGSDIPDRAGYPAQLWSRSTAFYDPAWLGVFLSLAFPTEQTLVDLWQESMEALEITSDNLALLQSIQDVFTVPEDFAELRDMLELHRDCTEIWLLVKDAVFRSQQVRGAEHAPYLQYDADRLLELADQMEVRWGPNVSPGNPGRIRTFVDDLRDRFPEVPQAVPWTQPRLSGIHAERLDVASHQIRWRSSEPMTSLVEWGTHLPNLPNRAESEGLTTEHTVDIDVDDPGKPHVFRVAGRTAHGFLVRSGDFYLGLDP